MISSINNPPGAGAGHPSLPAADSVVIWHDAENTILSADVDAVKLRTNLLDTIRAALLTCGAASMVPNELLFVQWQLVLPASAVGTALRKGPLNVLNQCGVNHIDPGTKKGAADVKIKQLINNWILERERLLSGAAPREAMSRTVAVLLSGDSDFNNELFRLGQLGVHVVVVHNEANGSRALAMSATAVIPEWQRIMASSRMERAPSPGRHSSPPRYLPPGLRVQHKAKVHAPRDVDEERELGRLLQVLRSAAGGSILGCRIPPTYSRMFGGDKFPLKVGLSIQALRARGVAVTSRPHGLDKLYSVSPSACLQAPRRCAAMEDAEAVPGGAPAVAAASPAPAPAPAAPAPAAPAPAAPAAAREGKVEEESRDDGASHVRTTPAMAHVFTFMRSLHHLVCDSPTIVLGSAIPVLFFQRYGADVVKGLGPFTISEVATLFGWKVESWQGSPVYSALASSKDLDSATAHKVVAAIKLRL